MYVELLHTVHAVINVRFEQDSYVASENVLAMVCVVVDVPFERPFMVRVATISETATGIISLCCESHQNLC